MAIDVIDRTSAIEVRGGRHMYSELTDAGYDLADRIELWLELHPGHHTPSRIGQAVHASTAACRAVLTWMAAHHMVTTTGNGARQRFTTRHRQEHQR
ncbi:hypothetical protein [Mycolicibacterium llatzerense]|uniref:hypothetical protein n=1 Tax=Mycolicibacterium llatzerense TaxID=280871 RepID=UPI0021B597C1|nr:hypothetical protein [Mycolicibacterium llatzerense]MCT7372994.1 hypothetical protein [Mycolicibacterium llatzerense]